MTHVARRVSLRSSLSLLAATTVFSAVLLAAPAAHAATVVTPAIGDRGLDLHVKPFARVTSPDGTTPQMNTMTTQGDKVFVSTQQGQVFEITGGQSVLRYDFAALLPQVAQGRKLNFGNAQHGGLRGFAFSPDFATDRKVYTAALEDRPTDPGAHHYVSDVTNPIQADSVLAEWTVGDDGKLSPTGYRELFRVGMPVYDHPIKEILFGPDRMLYIAHGDASVQSAIAGGGLANDALGKIMRIDPHPSADLAYTIPADNPFVNDPLMIDEAWSVGHRNPHTLSFTPDGLLIDTEVGRDNVDEVNIIRKAASYGWPDREGTFVHKPSGGLGIGVEALPADDAKYGYTYPVAQVGHDGPAGAGFIGIGLAGGYAVTNGSPADGEYLYAEFATQGQIFHSSLAAMKAAVTKGDPATLTQASTSRARIFFDDDGDPATPAVQKASMLDVINDASTYVGGGRADIRFGRGPGGEVYVTTKTNGLVYLITSTVPNGPGGFTGVRTHVEAETGTLAGSAVVARGHSGFSASGFVEYLNSTGAGVDGLVVNRRTASTAVVTVAYANGGGPAGTHTMGVLVNGTRVATASFASTGAWNSYTVTKVAVPLVAGTNRIGFTQGASDTGWVNLDFIEVTDQTGTTPPVEPPVPDPTPKVEAETGTLAGGATVSKAYAGYTGTGVVSSLTQVGAGVSALRVVRPSARPTSLSIRYATGTSATRTLTLSVDGKAVGRVSFPGTSSFTAYRTATVALPLTAGTRSLALAYASGDSGNVNVDALEVTDKVALIEAEGGSLSGGVSVYKDAGYTGTGAVGRFTRSGAQVSNLALTRTAAGPTTLAIRYATGTSAARTLTLYVDGRIIGRVTFPGTSSWTAYRTVNVPVTLTKGAHTLALRFNSGDSGNVAIDSIQPSAVVEAEAGKVSGGAVSGSGQGTPSGTGYVEWLTQPGAAVEGLTVTRGAAGTATLGIVYSAGSGGPAKRTLSVFVGGKLTATVEFPTTTNWATYATKTVAVPLAAGDNTIDLKVGSADGGWVNVDAITS